VGVYIEGGSRYETAQNNGVAHFLEHMTFKGTGRRTREDLEQEVENMGAHLNAYTSREHTVYYVNTFKEHVPWSMDILGDILQNSKIDPTDINHERDVILREMQEVDGQLDEVIFDRLHETAFRNCSLGRTILGSVDNIRTITQQQIKEYVATHYTAPRLVIAGAGGVSHDELVKLAQKHFGNVPRTAPNGKTPYSDPAVFTGSDIRIRNDEMELAHVAIGFPLVGWSDPDCFPLMLIQTLLGSWDKNMHGGIHSSSWLVSNVAKNGWAERFSTFNTLYSDTGLFGVYGVVQPTACNNFIYAVLRSLSILSHGVDSDALEQAKTMMKLNLLAHLDGSSMICEDIGRQQLTYRRRLHPTEMIERVDAIDANAIRSTAQRFFWDRDFALAAIGPIYELPDYNWIRARTYLDRF